MPGTTPVYGFPYPEPTDLVADYPALGQQLAEDIEDVLPNLGKIRQVVRATDTTTRSTTSTSFTDITGMSVTITPQVATSLIYVWVTGFGVTRSATSGSNQSKIQITTSGNTPLSGAEDNRYGWSNFTLAGGNTDIYVPISILGYHAPGSTAAATYKARFCSGISTTTTFLDNATTTGQIIAVEVTA